MRTLFAFIFTILILAGCQQKKYGAFVVVGRIENAAMDRIALQEIPFSGEQPLTLDSATLKKDGTFELRAMAKEEGLYRLVFADGKQVLLVNDGNSIKVKLDINNFRNYTIQGSEASSQLHTLMERLWQKDSVYFSLNKQLNDTTSAPALRDSLASVNFNIKSGLLKQRRDILNEFITKSNSPAAICYALGMYDNEIPVSELKKTTDAAAARFPEHSGLARYKSLIAMQLQQAEPPYALLGKQAPEIKLPTPKGDSLSLSNLRGKYVLIDFWASWCGPCRNENPNVVEAFRRFKDKNFTILGVSLDDDKAAWEKAIQADGLTWQHVSDLQRWNTPLVNTYDFKGIPFNVLVDPSGKIVANNLRGEALLVKLASVLK